MRYCLILALLFFSHPSQAGEVFKLAEEFKLLDQTIPAGSSKSWMQTVAGTQIPITIIHGQHPGPVLNLTAGIHGDEFPGILALQKIRQHISPANLHGTLILIHLANLEGFHARRVALSPVDEKNLNRVFSGRPDGTLTEQIAYFLTQEIISKTDYLIDIHSGSSNQTLLPHVYSPVKYNVALDNKTLAFAKSLGLQHIVLYDERPNDLDNAISYPNAAQNRGKPALTLEIGHLGHRDAESVDAIIKACMAGLEHLGMLKLKSDALQEFQLYHKLISIQSPATGLFTPKLKVGHIVKKGEIVGEVSDYFGNTVAEIKSPVSGRIMMIKETPPIKTAESLLSIGLLQ